MLAWCAPVGEADGATAKAPGGPIAAAHGEHPTVAEVVRAGYFTILTRERALSDRMPAHLAWAISDAVGASGARKHKVDEAVTRALRARHTIGPSGALLDKSLPANILDAREALVLGWLRLLTASDSDAVARRQPLLTDAGALQLLEIAAAKAPDEQTHHLALAVARALAGPSKGKGACTAWLAVQTQARDGRRRSAGLAVAEAALARVSKLKRSCPRARRSKLPKSFNLAPPPSERLETVVPMATAPAQVFDAGQRDGVAFAVLAPVFKGYLGLAEVRQVAAWSRLDERVVAQLLRTDRTGDQLVAAINAAVSLDRVSPVDMLNAVWKVVAGRHRSASQRATDLRVSMLSGPEAMAMAYAKALTGAGLDTLESSGDVAALRATPRQLFARARSTLPANAALGPIMAMAHTVDLQRQAGPCQADSRAESLIFVVGKSALPDVSRAPLLAALHAVRNQCRIVRAGPAASATGARGK